MNDSMLLEASANDVATRSATLTRAITPSAISKAISKRAQGQAHIG
jgi:hypothetical protein